MSTRGLFGFRKNGEVKAVYHHFDSYPDGLGLEFAKLLCGNTGESLSWLFDNIEVIDPDSIPTDEQKAYCIEHKWFDGTVSDRNTDDWYCLLRKLQDIEEYERAIAGKYKVYIENSVNFIYDSLFCEYAYIYDIDNGELEFYEGFQKTPQKGNPFGEKPAEGNEPYYPCRLMARIPVEGKTPEEILEAINACYPAPLDEDEE